MNSIQNPDTPTKEKNNMAIASLVLGILSLFVPIFGVIPAILAIIFGCKGRKQHDGKGMATAGLVLGILGIILGGVLLICTAILAKGIVFLLQTIFQSLFEGLFS